MKDITKIYLTIVITLTLGFVEWKMWHFFRHEFKTYNPTDEIATFVFIAWMFLAVIFLGMAAVLLANIYTPKKERDANDQGQRREKKRTKRK